MKLINKSDLKDNFQYVCTYEYNEKLFSITLIYLDNVLHLMENENGNFIEDIDGLNFVDSVSSVQYWEI